MLLDELERSPGALYAVRVTAIDNASGHGSATDYVRDVIAALRTSGMLAAAGWLLFEKLDEADDFPLIKVRWGPIRFRITKEHAEPILRWFLTKLVGPKPASVPPL